jgi:DNA invertase Pin-like site-specific DNA recombinase
MKTYYAYIRVSTTRQGEEGVSLQEQKRAILEYASKRGISIAEWFEEQESAAKRGRPVFGRLVTLLKAKKQVGIIIHKIDRGARNLRDWADIAELMDQGIEVHFAHESIDLYTRSGRLSADILAVVAADYIRNLREEVVKGINGRLRQGLFPFSAPVGYLNNGSGKAKTIDPVRGPLITAAFELYASKQYSLKTLEAELYSRGLRTKTGKTVFVSHLSMILRNPYYMGLIRVRGRKETLPGVHEPLVTSGLYNQVQSVLLGRHSCLRRRNHFIFSLLLRCEHCKLFLVGERQKGHVYYRCHRRSCHTTCIREEKVQSAVIAELKRINIAPEEEPILAELLPDLRRRDQEISQRLRKELKEDREHVQQSIQSLLQKFLDGAVSQELFDQGHTSLLLQRQTCDEKLGRLDKGKDISGRLEEFIAELRSLCQRFCAGSPAEMRKLLEDTFGSITVGTAAIHVFRRPIYETIANRDKTLSGWQTLLPAILKELAVK